MLSNSRDIIGRYTSGQMNKEARAISQPFMHVVQFEDNIMLTTCIKQIKKPSKVAHQVVMLPPLTSGNDVITLTSPGKKWYIRGISKYCEKGVKLAITVLAAELGAPAALPSSLSGPASWISPNFKFVAMVVAA
ncbi:hypothetical protein CQW23_25534 [Capsicum baccatum]|uniref:Phytocyanin domain-containing protein n=1 Tax=Capsicum baccatum TaxID=33114 RepID=A0A2G2VL73_CAPBA|nr:hypothetical protein CQW23_25534 [Capsicum baccatum]